MTADASNGRQDDHTVVLHAYEQTYIGPPSNNTSIDPAPSLLEAISTPGQALLACQAFREIGAEVRHAVADALVPFHFSADETLISQGVPGRGLWIIASGCVDVHVHGDLDRTVFINSVGPGEVLGEMSLLTKQPATASAVATGPTLAYLLPAEAFHRLAGPYSSLCVVLTNVVANRLGGADIDVLAGKTMGGYRIRGRLGRGGMSIVYDADRMDDGLRAALKMMSHRLVYDALALEYFHREADLIAGFDHPHIVRLLGRFEAFHTYFIAMEYCDGEDLKTLLGRKQRLPVDDVRRILGQLASALEYSHQSGVVHRDIKPSNVMLTQSGRVMLMDFGLAKPSMDAVPTSGAMGTPRYMPIEQLRCEPVDCTADYFSFGCLAYELLMGRPLITATTPASLLEFHDNWSVPELLKPCAHFDADLRSMLAGALHSDARRRKLDLAAITRWAGENVC